MDGEHPGAGRGRQEGAPNGPRLLGWPGEHTAGGTMSINGPPLCECAAPGGCGVCDATQRDCQPRDTSEPVDNQAR
jgi:hypothetical protein